MALFASACLFAVFLVNVLMGSFGGNGFLSDVSEMLVLFVSAIFFVIAILKKEAEAKETDGQ